MRLLLDSHVLLWWRIASPRLPEHVIAEVSAAVDVYVSAATAWELGLKASIGKLRLPEPVEDGVRDSGFLELPITFAHTRIAAALPLHHRDPFDRMLIAQALDEGLTLVSHDAALVPYGVPMIWVP